MLMSKAIKCNTLAYYDSFIRSLDSEVKLEVCLNFDSTAAESMNTKIL